MAVVAMDIPLVLQSLRPGEDWGPCANSTSTYAQLADTWRSKVSIVPTEAEMQTTWVTVQANMPAQKIAKDRADAKVLIADVVGTGKILRAIAATLIDELNILRADVMGVTIGISTFVWDPPSIANAAGATSASITVAGAAFGDVVDVAAPYTLAGLVACGFVSAANTVLVRLHNGTGAAVNLASGTWGVAVRRPAAALAARTLAQARTAIDAKIDSGAVDS